MTKKFQQYKTLTTNDLPKTIISYCGYQLKDFPLPSDYSDFKIQLKRTFSLEQILKEDDPIKIHYKEDKNNKEVNDDSDYKAMVEYISKKGNAIVYMETEKIPVSFEGGNSIEFEDEIKKVVERELRIAANNIKKCLTTNISLSNSKKVRTQCCKECKKQIIGYLYKAIDKENEDSYYCELCSTNIDTPLFKIN